jgi:hypothetical protein
MSLVFPQRRSLADAVACSDSVVRARVLRLSGDGRIAHVLVERVLRGPLVAGAELEVRPAGHALGLQIAAALAAGAPAPSFALPMLDGSAPEAAPGASLVFLLAGPSAPGVHEESVLQGRRTLQAEDPIARLCAGSAPPPTDAPRG